MNTLRYIYRATHARAHTTPLKFSNASFHIVITLNTITEWFSNGRTVFFLWVTNWSSRLQRPNTLNLPFPGFDPCTVLWTLQSTWPLPAAHAKTLGQSKTIFTCLPALVSATHLVWLQKRHAMRLNWGTYLACCSALTDATLRVVTSFVILNHANSPQVSRLRDDDYRPIFASHQDA